MTEKHIKIGPEFFQKAKNDYACWKWALVREFMQNGVDCGSTFIKWSVVEQDGKTHVKVRNDGEPMDREILFDKLLSLGSSGKDFVGPNTGGFGKAKEILYFCWDGYRIRTGSLIVAGSGGSYTEETNGYLNGTESCIIIDGLVADELKQQFEKWCFFAQVKCTMYWNDQSYDCDMRKGSQRRDLGFGKVYTNRSTEYKMVVRMNGMPMFVQRVGIDRCVVVELEGKSNQQLTSNRDALTDAHRWDLSSFVTELSVDKRSALKAHQPKYRHYDGSRLCHRKVREVKVSQILDLDEPEQDEPEQDEPEQAGTDRGRGGPVEFDLVQDGAEPVGVGTGGFIPANSGDAPRTAAYSAPAPVKRVRVAVGEEFVIKNETDLVVPTYYRPDEPDWSTHSQKLAKIWGRLMLQVHRTFDVEDEFAIGFLFTDDTSQLAEHEDGQFGKVYYICPAELVEQSGSYSKSWKKRWKLTDRNGLLMAAVHEFLHGRGYSYHDEDYANRLTHAAAKVMDNRKDFNWCFK